MKRRILLVSLFLTGAVIFFIGWVQLSIPPDRWTLGFSKISGWDSRIIEPGTFVWRWERLIPGAYSLHEFPIQSYRIPVSISGELPSGSFYSRVLEGSPSFGYELTVDLQISFRRETFPSLVRTEQLVLENFDSWLERKKEGIAQIVTGIILEEGIPRLLSESHQSWQAVIQDILFIQWNERFPYVSLDSATLSRAMFPDLALYQKGRTLYLSIEEAKKATLIQESIKRTIEALRQEKRLETLQKYGELLQKYPILIEFLTIEKLGTLSLEDVQSLRRLRQ